MTDSPSPGTVRQQPETLRTAVKTSLGDNRAWFIFDLINGGYYSVGTECADWPPLSAEGSEG